jgi:hypothetical protein
MLEIPSIISASKHRLVFYPACANGGILTSWAPRPTEAHTHPSSRTQDIFLMTFLTFFDILVTGLKVQFPFPF